MAFEIELDRQVVQPGDEIVGWVTIHDPEIESIEIAFQGEEILGANDVVKSLVLPVVDEKLELGVSEGARRGFRFTVPEEASASYSSQDIRCQYAIKATVHRRGFWRRSVIRKLIVTVLPTLPEEIQFDPVTLEVDHPGLRLIVSLEQNVVLTGESLTGTLFFEKKEDSIRLPTMLSFRLASIEESTDTSFPHRKVLTLETHDIDIDQTLQLPFTGFFEFPIPTPAEPSGTWNLFKVHYGFRVAMYDYDGKDYRESTSIEVLRDLKPWIDKPGRDDLDPDAH